MLQSTTKLSTTELKSSSRTLLEWFGVASCIIWACIVVDFCTAARPCSCKHTGLQATTASKSPCSRHCCCPCHRAVKQ
jgi:hypothetical protein